MTKRTRKKSVKGRRREKDQKDEEKKGEWMAETGHRPAGGRGRFRALLTGSWQMKRRGAPQLAVACHFKLRSSAKQQFVCSNFRCWCKISVLLWWLLLLLHVVIYVDHSDSFPVTLVARLHVSYSGRRLTTFCSEKTMNRSWLVMRSASRPTNCQGLRQTRPRSILARCWSPFSFTFPTGCSWRRGKIQWTQMQSPRTRTKLTLLSKNKSDWKYWNSAVSAHQKIEFNLNAMQWNMNVRDEKMYKIIMES